MQASRLTGQSLLRAEWNSNECNWSTARKKIGPVNRPCDRPIDVFSIASLMFWVTSRLADQRKTVRDRVYQLAPRTNPKSRQNIVAPAKTDSILPPFRDQSEWAKAFSKLKSLCCKEL